ncbi:MAG: c-type cytochrome [Rubrivivax sp.]
MKAWHAGVALLLAGAALVAAALSLPSLDRAADLRSGAAAPATADPAAVARGAYLATLGHCAGCHDAPGGGARYAGGRVVATPFGGVVAANLTPDADTGLGRWTAAAFRRALHDGRSADGRPLLPACPTTHFGLIGEADADDLFAFLRSLPAQRAARAPHELRWPYGSPQALWAWRALHHRPPQLPPAPPGARADWARGAWLVGGPGHCGACHGRRDAWGATDGSFDLRGGPLPGQGWLAPSLADPRQAAVSGWTEDEVVALLRDGRNRHATVSGPMARVVAHSTQHWCESDLRAAAEFLRRLPPVSGPRPPASPPPDERLRRGEQLYADQCADCHGRQGEGRDDDGPALAGNRALALDAPDNVVHAVLAGGFGPATARVPRPAGMPPFATTLSDEDIAAVVSFARWRFGAQASGVDAHEVNRRR